MHKALGFNSKISLVILSIVVIGVIFGVNQLQIFAQTPEVYHKEIEIIPDPNDPNLFTFIGNVCVDSKDEIIDPKVMLFSDTEEKPLWLKHVFYSDECFGAVEKIRANDPDSIEAKVVAYGNYSVIKEMEEKIAELEIEQSKLQKEIQEISSDKFPDSPQKYIDTMREKSDTLFKTQKLLQKETAKYYEIMRYLHPSE